MTPSWSWSMRSRTASTARRSFSCVSCDVLGAAASSSARAPPTTNASNSSSSSSVPLPSLSCASKMRRSAAMRSAVSGGRASDSGTLSGQQRRKPAKMARSATSVSQSATTTPMPRKFAHSFGHSAKRRVPRSRSVASAESASTTRKTTKRRMSVPHQNFLSTFSSSASVWQRCSCPASTHAPTMISARYSSIVTPTPSMRPWKPPSQGRS
mmetsp:Transcript_27995/g.96763  ORF Transcript_27995/g.96763 Transcript_27995/m.96763 type:complete len:211 (+) Transcript_27995:741-1373(+)